MQSQVATAISTLADRLAVPATKIWEVLVRQAYVEAGQGLIWLLITITFWLVSVPRVRELTKDWDEYADEGKFIILWVARVLAVIGTLACVAFAIQTLTQLLNPEGFAAMQVISALKPK